jgi:UPF0716 family protein affecting phage T7 exclusion
LARVLGFSRVLGLIPLFKLLVLSRVLGFFFLKKKLLFFETTAVLSPVRRWWR